LGSCGVQFRDTVHGAVSGLCVPQWVAKEFLVGAISTLGPRPYLDRNITDLIKAPKRTCRRPLEESGGELAEFSRLGMSKFMMNLDGDSFCMWDKTNIGAREKKLFLLFRMLYYAVSRLQNWLKMKRANQFSNWAEVRSLAEQLEQAR
jgi:hypothetical protein